MTISNTKLNEVAKLLNTTDKNLVISACIKTLIENGTAVDVAIDTVLGGGTTQTIIDSLYSNLNK